MEKIYKGEIQRLFPIFEAIKEGKTIQWLDMGLWRDIDGDDEGFFLDTLVRKTEGYRIKPEPKYRPFANAEECWTEMRKHQPFGWVKKTMKNGEIERRFMIVGVQENYIVWVVNGAVLHWEFNKLFEAFYCFADGVPFGVKVEG